jgi:vacuolar-type H+-ATPase subunit F/Vma7
MAGVQVICSAPVAAGFRLAGIPVLEVADPAVGVDAVRKRLQGHAEEVLLVEQGIYDALGEAEGRALARRPLPLVVPFPGPRWLPVSATSSESFIAELLRQAIGYRVRLG